MKNKCHKTELCLLITMLFCYAGCLSFFLAGNKTDTIALFLLHSCLALAYFFMLSVRYSRIPINDHSADAAIASALEDTAKALKTLKAQHEALLCETKQKDKMIADLTSQASPKPSQCAPAPDFPKCSLLPPPTQQTSLDLLSIAANMAEQYQKYAFEKGGNICVSSANNALRIKACENHITILFQNIMDNSIKYMTPLGSLVITLSGIGDTVLIVFKDNGAELAQSELEHIFDLNYQGTNRRGGSGLGLAQAKAIVAHYHGSITAKSENGVGIYIELPFEME